MSICRAKQKHLGTFVNCTVDPVTVLYQQKSDILLFDVFCIITGITFFLGNIFVGQTESPLLIRPYIEDLTTSELHTVMTAGFGTIAGSVLGAYLSFGVSNSFSLPEVLSCKKWR